MKEQWQCGVTIKFINVSYHTLTLHTACERVNLDKETNCIFVNEK